MEEKEYRKSSGASTDGRINGKKTYGKPAYGKKPYGKSSYGRPSYGKKPYENKSETDGERKPYGDRAEGDGERKSFGDRKPYGERKSFGDRKPYGERKSFGDRKPYGERKSFGDRKPYGERKPYGDRAEGDGERKSFGDRKPYGERKSFGDRKPYGERKSFGDRKPYGERKSFGDRKSYGDRKPYGDRAEGDGERKSFGDRKPYGERKSFGDRKPYGERKSFGDRKPYGERKSFGDRKPYGERKPYGDRAEGDGERKSFAEKKPYDGKPRTSKWSDRTADDTPRKAYEKTYLSSVQEDKESKKAKKAVRPDRTYTATYMVDRSDTLLEFLLKKCKTSRNNVKTLLAKKKVLVNGSVATQFDFVLAKDDEIKLAHDSVLTEDGRIHKEEKAEKRSVRTKNKEKSEKPDFGKLIKIIYEDDDFIAIDKPCGLLSVESDNETECAFSYVFNYLQGKDKNLRPFILHRIDKETSGVLVFAKDVKIHSMLKTNWNDLVSTREYFAVVEGVPERKEDTIESYLKENENNLMYSTNDPSGQKAITHYVVDRSNDKYSLLKVNIATGRKNQIRVHMHEAGHPVVGDEKYGFTKDPLKRLGLHASKLEFTHPVSGEVITLVAPLPPSFLELFR